MRDGRPAGPSWWYCVPGALVILAGCGLFLHTTVHGVARMTDSLVQIVVPGEGDLTLLPTADYTVFLETQSVVDGRIYSTKSASGLSCFVTSKTSGKRIDTYRPAMNTTYSIGARDGRSVLGFRTEEAGVYRVSCDYGTGREGPQVVVAVGTGVGERIFSILVKGLASIVGGLVLGGAAILTVVVLRVRSNRH
jgi:hypothetical protein